MLLRKCINKKTLQYTSRLQQLKAMNYTDLGDIMLATYITGKLDTFMITDYMSSQVAFIKVGSAIIK